MANRFFRNTGNTSWNVTTNWSATDGGASVGAIPVAGDSVFFTSLSGSCSLNVNGTCSSIDFTGFTGTFNFNSNTLTLQNGTNSVTLSAAMTINGTGTISSLQVAGTSNWTSNGKSLSNINLTLNGSSAPTFNFVDSWTVNNLTFGGGIKTVSNGTINVKGNLAVNIGTSGTSTIVLNGTGTWTGTANLNNNLQINTTGTITVSGTVNYRTGTLSYIAGTVVTTGSTLALVSSCTLNTAGIVWNNVTTSGTPTITLNSTLTINGTLSNGNTQVTFAGTSGFVTNTFSLQSTTAGDCFLKAGITYRVTNLFQAISVQPSAGLNVRSGTSGTQAKLNLDAAAVCTLGYVNLTDIDASGGGRKITTFLGAISNCINVETYVDPLRSIGKSFVS